MIGINVREQKMKSIIYMSFGFGLLVTQVFGSTADIIEGAAGEAEATACFFEREVNSTVEHAEQALVTLKSALQGLDRTGVIVLYRQTAALTNLKATIEALEKLLPLFASSQLRVEQMRVMLAAMPNDPDAENIAE